MPAGIGAWEIAILMVVALLIFGPRRLPEIGRSLGRGLREFKQTLTGVSTFEEPASTLPPSEQGGGDAVKS